MVNPDLKMNTLDLCTNINRILKTLDGGERKHAVEETSDK